MNLENLTSQLTDHCLSLGFDSTGELGQYLCHKDDEDVTTRCEGIIHEMCHMLLLYGPDRLNRMWQQEDMDRALNKLSEEDQDENEIETTALTIMIARDVGSEAMESIARGNVRGNLSPMFKYREIDDLLDPYLISSNLSNYNDLLSFIRNL